MRASGLQALRVLVRLTTWTRFLADLLQVILGQPLNGAYNHYTTLVGFIGFGDDAEVDVSNELEDHSSMKDQASSTDIEDVVTLIW